MSKNLSTLAKFSDQLLEADHFTHLSNIAISNISHQIKSLYASFMLFDLSSLHLVSEKRRGFHSKRDIQPTLEQCDELEQCNSKFNTVFVLPRQNDPSIFSFFDPEEPHDCEIRIPFAICTKYLGLINIGKKKSGEAYSNEELNYLQVVANFISTASFRSKLCPARGLLGKEQHHPCTDKTCSQNGGLMPRIHKSRGYDNEDLLGESSAMEEIREVIAQIASEDVPVLITGESGTGKELIARAIHQQSQRANKPMVAMNCAAHLH